MLSRLRAVRMGHRDAGSHDAGMTLIETTMAMVLMTIVGALCLNFFLGNTRQADLVTEQTLNGAQVRVAAEGIAGLLRVADTPAARAGFAAGRIETMTATRLVFYANLDKTSRVGTSGRTPPSKIDISVVGTQLVQKTYAPKTKYTTYPNPYNYVTNYLGTPTSSAVLITSLQNTSAVFSYCTSATDPMNVCSPATDPTTVASIRVTLTVATKPGSAPQTLTTLVAITGAVI